jgi:hypothetical protein
MWLLAPIGACSADKDERLRVASCRPRFFLAELIGAQFQRDPLPSERARRHVEHAAMASDDVAPISAGYQRFCPTQLGGEGFQIDPLLNPARLALRASQRVRAEQRADGLRPAREERLNV